MSDAADIVHRHRLWAIVSEQGALLERVDGPIDEAIERGEQYGRVVVDLFGMREAELEEPAPSRRVANPKRRLQLIEQAALKRPVVESSRLAQEASGLPTVTVSEVLKKWPLERQGAIVGLPRAAASPFGEGLAKAHALIRPLFPTEWILPGGSVRKVERWQSPTRSAEHLMTVTKKQMKVPTPDGKELTTSIFGLALAPNWTGFAGARRSERTLCLWSTAQCRSMCLVYHGEYVGDPYILKIKIAKTRALLEHPDAFLRLLIAALWFKRAQAQQVGAIPACRLNLFSDIPWERVFPDLFDFFDDIAFYDYTKIPGRRTPDNYDLTYSYSGEPTDDPALAKARRRNLIAEVRRPRRVAVVFLRKQAWKDSGRWPETFRGLRVIDGEKHDLRPLDPPNSFDPDPVVVGLDYKPPHGRAARARSQTDFDVFVVPVHEVEGHLIADETPRFTLLLDEDEDD